MRKIRKKEVKCLWNEYEEKKRKNKRKKRVPGKIQSKQMQIERIPRKPE